MAYGDHPEDAALKAAWQKFCRQLETAGNLAFKDFNPATDLHRADAFRFLTQNLGQAFDLGLETKDPAYPTLHAFCGPNRKLGGDAADLTYHQAWIDGQFAYRVSGTRGSARFMNFTVQGARPEKQPGTSIPSLHDPFGDIPEANLFGNDLQVAADGSFELFIGGQRRECNWLPVTPQTRKLFIRQGFDAWNEEPAQLSIERLGMNEPRPLPTPRTMVSGMAWAGQFVESLMRDWPDHPYRYSPFVDPDKVNAFPPDPAEVAQDDKKRGRAVANLVWELQPEEALIIEFDAHQGFWMVSLMGAFFSSMDYWYRPVSYTPSRTAVDSDDKIRLVLSATDPGYHNWLDTQHFVRGSVCYRNLMSTEATSFRTETVKLSALAQTLPADSAVVTKEQRQEQMMMRYNAIRRRYRM